MTQQRHKLIKKTRNAVKARLTTEISYWDRLSQDLKQKETSGESDSRYKSEDAENYAIEMQERLNNRFNELDLEENISPLPPKILGKFMIVPIGLINKISPTSVPQTKISSVDKQQVARRARNIIMEEERKLGNNPTDREIEKLGYDIESIVPNENIKFIEVKGRIKDAPTITVTKNEILFSLNKPNNYILAIVEFEDQSQNSDYKVYYVRHPFNKEPDFGVTSVNYDFSDLISRADPPN